MWIERCDYIESFYRTIQGKYSIIDESLPYYLGMLNLSIYYLNDYSSYYDYAFIQHKNISECDYCNPLQFKIDIKERDFGEYLKYLFFTNQYRSVDLSSLIASGSSYFNYVLVFARMLYPNYYFDLLDDVILEKKNSFVLNEIISRISEYEDYLKNIFHEFEKYCRMPVVYF